MWPKYLNLLGELLILRFHYSNITLTHWLSSHLHHSQDVLIEDLAMPSIPQICGTFMDAYILVVFTPFLPCSPPWSLGSQLSLYCTITIQRTRTTQYSGSAQSITYCKYKGTIQSQSPSGCAAGNTKWTLLIRKRRVQTRFIPIDEPRAFHCLLGRSFFLL